MIRFFSKSYLLIEDYKFQQINNIIFPVFPMLRPYLVSGNLLLFLWFFTLSTK